MFLCTKNKRVLLSEACFRSLLVGRGFFYVRTEKRHRVCVIYYAGKTGESVSVVMTGKTRTFAAFLVLLFEFLVFSCGEAPSPSKEAPLRADPPPELLAQIAESDVIVLGKIDACWVCDSDKPPHVSYTQVLSGAIPGGNAYGQLPLTGVARYLLPYTGVPIYQSNSEEICLLKRSVRNNLSSPDFYEVIYVWEATTERLNYF